MVRIKPEYTKTGVARTTFLSIECQRKMDIYLDGLNNEDRVFEFFLNHRFMFIIISFFYHLNV